MYLACGGGTVRSESAVAECQLTSDGTGAQKSYFWATEIRQKWVLKYNNTEHLANSTWKIIEFVKK